MNEKQKLFCLEYLKDLNATQAAIRAGYEPASARMQGSRLMTNDDILQHIETLKAERMESVKIDADYVLNRLRQIDQLDVIDIMDDDGNLLPVTKWPKEWRLSISGLELAEMHEHKDNQKELIGIMKKIKWPDKTKNLELIGKHIDVQAFNEKKTIEHVDRSTVLANARKRALAAKEVQGERIIDQPQTDPEPLPPAADDDDTSVHFE